MDLSWNPLFQNQSFGGNYQHPNRLFAANQIGVATTLPHSAEGMPGQMSNNIDNDIGHSAQSTHSQDERFSHRDTNIASSEVNKQIDAYLLLVSDHTESEKYFNMFFISVPSEEVIITTLAFTFLNT